MSITTSAFRFALTAAALCAASTADARPRRVVILDFDGPRQLADLGRSSVLSVLGNQYDVVATQRWENARKAAAQVRHGPAQWSSAAKQTGVDAVIEGWVQDEGRRKILNITVREADNGKEFDTISVRLDGKNGVSTESSRQLQASLDEVLDWIDAGQNEPPPGLPTINVKKLGPSRPPIDDDAGVRRGRRAPIDDEAAPATGAGQKRPRRTAGADGEVTSGDQPGTATRAAGRPEPEADAGSAAAPEEPAHEARPTTVSTAEREIHEIELTFPPGTEERKDVLGVKVDHVPEKTPIVNIDAGGYLKSRSLIWDASPDSAIPQFAGVSTKGFQVNAAVYPFPLKKMDGELSGVGFTGSLHHSAGSSVEFDNMNEGTIEEYVINQTGWELGVHYRTPLSSLVTIDGGAFYGSETFEILDASPNFEVPDTKYSYLGVSGHLDLAITDRARVGFGARYFTVLDTGDLASVDWFGPVSASGLGLEGSFLIPLPENLYVRGQLSYQRISLETSGGGQLTDDDGVTGGTDAVITGAVNIGIAF
jgi:hypothetical protein